MYLPEKYKPHFREYPKEPGAKSYRVRCLIVDCPNPSKFAVAVGVTSTITNHLKVSIFMYELIDCMNFPCQLISQAYYTLLGLNFRRTLYNYKFIRQIIF